MNSQSITRTLARNITANWVGFAVQVTVTFFLTPYVLHSLGEARYGVWAIVMSLTGYYGFLDLGFRASFTQHITRYLATENYAELNRSASTGLLSCAGVGCIVLIASCGFAFGAPYLFDMAPELVRDVRWAILIVGIGAALQFPFFVFGAVFPATQRYDFANAIGITTRLMQAAGIVVALRFGYGLIGVSVAVLAANLLDYLLKWRLAYRMIPQLNLTFQRTTFSAFREFLSFGVWNTVIDGSRRVLNYADMLIIGLLLPVEAVAPYALAAGIVGHLDTLLSPITKVFFPMATRLHARGELSSLKNMYIFGTRFVLSIAVISAVVGSVWAHDFFQLWVGNLQGNGLELTSQLFVILVCSTTISTGQRIGYQVFLGSGNVKPLAILFAVECTIKVALSLLLGKLFGIFGIALGTLISTAFVQGMLHPAFLRRLLSMPVREYGKGILLRPILVGLCVATFCVLLRLAGPNAHSWFTLGMYGLIAGSVSIAVLFAIGLSADERRTYVVGRIFRRREATSDRSESRQDSSQLCVAASSDS